MTDIQAWLDQGRTLTDQATEGPWEARSSEATMNDRAEWKIGKYNRPQALRSVMRGADAVFVADARTRLPQALAALQAIHDLHQPVEFVGHSATWLRCTQGCPTWPCPTRQALPHLQADTETAQGKPTDDEDQA